MTFLEKLENRIKSSNSRVCVGLDSTLEKLPTEYTKSVDSLLDFNKRIIDATHEHVLAYKPNIAFYEALGVKGWTLLEKTIEHIPNDIITIADAKRGDIGNTAKMYAQTFFDTYPFDSITVNPYMGYDSVSPYLEYKDKGTIILGLTSNKGSEDIQELKLDEHTSVAEHVCQKIVSWNKNKNCLLVVGATNSEKIKRIREASSDLYFLVPGIGAQGGSLEDVIRYGGKNVIINSSRSIIYASSDKNFAIQANEETLKLKDAINNLIDKWG